jgi:hypothetical protein
MKCIIGFLALMLGLHSVAQPRVTVVIHSKTGYTGFENFADQSAQKLQQTLNSEKFQQAILTGNFTETNGLSNQQIYDAIMLAHEKDGEGGRDNVVDLRVRTLTLERDGKRWMRNCRIGSWAGTIGVDGSGDGVTAICPQRLKLWFDAADMASLAGHYAHEYMHILGFSHRKKKSTSLVYQVGDIIEQIVREGMQ